MFTNKLKKMFDEGIFPSDEIVMKDPKYDEIYNKIDSSLEPCYMLAQSEVLENEDW